MESERGSKKRFEDRQDKDKISNSRAFYLSSSSYTTELNSNVGNRNDKCLDSNSNSYETNDQYMNENMKCIPIVKNKTQYKNVINCHAFQKWKFGTVNIRSGKQQVRLAMVPRYSKHLHPLTEQLT